MEEAVPPSEKQQSGERYVEELISSDDYWMTITDSARATRRQDITIRRWIASGELPVRKYRVGLNRRSRQVRASDVAKLTPIIDTSAMISGEEARISLTNIPAEQAAIRADHQQLLTDMSALQAAIIEQKLATEQAMTQQQKNWQQELRVAQEGYHQGLTRLQQGIESQQQTVAQIHTDLLAQLAQHAEMAQQHWQQLNQFQKLLLAQENQFQSALQDQRKALETVITQQLDQVHQDIGDLKSSVAEVNQAMIRSTETFTVRLEQVKRAGLDQATQQEQEIQNLKVSFLQEQKTMAQQVALLATQIAEYQSNQEQILKQTEARFEHIQIEGSYFQQEQAALIQRIATLTAQFVEQQSLQEHIHQQTEEQFAQLQESFAELKQQISNKEKEKAQKNLKGEIATKQA